MIEEKVLLEIPKNSGEILVVQIVNLKGKTYLDVRASWINQDGKCTPTKKGCFLTASMWRSLIPAIKSGVLEIEAG